MKRLVVTLIVAALAGAAPARADVYDDRPAAASRGAGDMVVVARGADGAIYERHIAGGSWTPWASLGGQAASGPAAAAYGNAVHVFVLGTDGAVWTNALARGAWTGWSSLGGQGTSAPAAVQRRGTRILDLVMRGTDNAIHHRAYQPGAGWSAWASLGGNLSSGPSLNSQDPGVLNVWSRGGSGDLVQRAWNGSAWSEWMSLGGVLTAAPAALARRTSLVDMFVRGADRGLHQRSWQGGSGWGVWKRVDPTPLDSAPAAVADVEEHVALFARRGAQLAVKEWRAGSGWTAWGDWGPVAPPAPPPPPPPEGRVRLSTGDRCTPPGGRLRVSLQVRKRPGRAAPRVRRVVFFVRRGPRRVDHRRPFARRLRLDLPAGTSGRVFARARYTRKGSKRVRSKTVFKRFIMCG